MPLFDTWIDAYKIYKEVRQFRKGLVPQGKATSAPSIVYDTPSTSMMGYSPGRSPRVLAQYGYVGNPVVYRAINIIADECGSIPLKVKTKGGTGKILENSPLLFLLSQPNLDKSKAAYIQQMVSYWLIAGTSYTYLATGRTPQPQALYQLRPDLVEVMATEQGITEYKYTTGRTVTHYTPEEVRPLRFFHPLDELYGLSPITVASIVIDRQNEGEQWNASFMKHAARPSGAFTMQGMLGEEEYQRLKSEIMQKYVGKNNAGTPLLLEGGLQYVQTGNSPLDADWNASDANAGRKIAMAIGVDPLLLNDKEHSTYNNIREARIALADTTVHPMMTHIIDEWNGWLAPRYGTDIEIFMDERYFDRMRDDINATSVRMQNEFTKGIMSFNTAQMLAGREAQTWGDFYQMGPQTYVQSKDMQEYLDQQHERRMAPPVLAPPGVPLLPDGGKHPLQLLPGGKNPPAPKDKVASKGWAMLMPTKVTEIAPARQTYAEQIEAMRSAWDTRFQAAMEMHFADEHSTIQQALVGVKTLQQAHSVIDSVLSSTVNNLASIFLKFYTNIGEDASRFVSEPLHVKSTLYRKSALSDLSQYAAQHIIGIDATTRNTVEEVFTQAYQQKSTMEDLQGYLDQVYTQFPTTRGINIAKTEVTASSNLGMYLTACDIASTHGITMEKTWVAIDDEYTRDTHGEAGNETIDLLEYFLLDGSEMLFPGDTSRDARPKERINCRCCCQYTVSLKFNSIHDSHGRFGTTIGTGATPLTIGGYGDIHAQIGAGQGILFRGAVPTKPKKVVVVTADDIPIDKLASADLKHFDAGYEGDNPRYTTIVDGTKYFVKHMEGNIAGGDPQGMYQNNKAASETFAAVGLAKHTVPMVEFQHDDGETYVAMPFAKGYKNLLKPAGKMQYAADGISDNLASKVIALEAIIGTRDRHAGQYLYNPNKQGDDKMKIIDFDYGYEGGQTIGYKSALMRAYTASNRSLDPQALKDIASKGNTFVDIANKYNVYDSDLLNRTELVYNYAVELENGNVGTSVGDLDRYMRQYSYN